MSFSSSTPQRVSLYACATDTHQGQEPGKQRNWCCNWHENPVLHNQTQQQFQEQLLTHFKLPPLLLSLYRVFSKSLLLNLFGLLSDFYPEEERESPPWWQYDRKNHKINTIFRISSLRTSKKANQNKIIGGSE